MNMAVFEGKKAADRWFPVYLATGNVAVTGITYTQATAYWGTAGAVAPNTYTLDANNWKEQGGGLYWLSLGSDEWATQAGYSLLVKATGADTAPAYVEVRDRLLTETDDDIISLPGTILDTLATAHQNAGSVGEALLLGRIVQAGTVVINTADNTMKYYLGTTLYLTRTVAQATGSPTITITPS